MGDLLTEVGRFRKWAGSNPPATRSQEGRLDYGDGEWECDYPHWPELYAAVMEHLAESPPSDWSGEQMQAVLYALARDNEGEHLVEEIGLRYPEALMALAAATLADGEPDAKWQLANQLGRLGREVDDVERLLLVLVHDQDEYVRRRALNSLACVGSSEVEQLALDAWNRPDDHQQWTRMQVLDCLRRIGSPYLERLLSEAERDERPYLRSFAKQFREERAE